MSHASQCLKPNLPVAKSEPALQPLLCSPGRAGRWFGYMFEYWTWLKQPLFGQSDRSGNYFFYVHTLCKNTSISWFLHWPVRPSRAFSFVSRMPSNVPLLAGLLWKIFETMALPVTLPVSMGAWGDLNHFNLQSYPVIWHYSQVL